MAELETVIVWRNAGLLGVAFALVLLVVGGIGIVTHHRKQVQS